MPSVIDNLTNKGLVSPPKFVVGCTHYETIMGSQAYGVSSESSDTDIYGFCIPFKDMLFPHLAGHIEGFGRQRQNFEQYQQHHINDKESGKQYDVSIYNIVRYVSLCMENNPNMLDSLFTPMNCVVHMTSIGNHIRENRKIFLHKGCWHKLKGYAYSQLHKMSSINREGKRKELYEKFGFDVKFAMHVVRLLSQAEQILTTGELDLQEPGRREHMKAIRRGEVSEKDIREWAASKEKQLEEVYHRSTLPYSPDEGRIKRLLLECLEMHYGNLSECVVAEDAATMALREVQAVLDRNRSILGR